MMNSLFGAHRRFWRESPWQSRAHRRWFGFCAVCLSLYIGYCTFLAQSPVLKGGMDTAASLCWFVLYSAAVYVLLLWACKRLSGVRLRKSAVGGRYPWRVFFMSAGISLVVLGCAFAACYPGGVSYDAANQWQQVRTGEFNNWHPLFHTLLVWLVTRVSYSYPFAVCAQLVAFSAAMGYLTSTLCRHGVPAWLALIVHALVTLSAPVQNTLMYLGKDSAMCIGALVLSAQGVNMLFTRGQWLRRPRNAVVFGLVLAFATLVRHNAVLFTLPLLLAAMLCYRPTRRWAALSAGVFALCSALIQGPLFGALDVVYPSNLLEESIGIPMTVMGNAKQKNPDARDEETSAFLATLADDEAWRNTYALNDYNSIKFTYDRERIAHTPPAQLLRMTLHTVASDPRGAFEAFNAVTDLVWDVTGQNEGYENVRNSGDIEEARYGSARLNTIGKAASAVLSAPMNAAPLAYLFQNIGVQLLLLLLGALWALYRVGVRALSLALPVLIYDLGTMLLLCGNDARFFQFSMAVCLPALVALLFASPEKEA